MEINEYTIKWTVDTDIYKVIHTSPNSWTCEEAENICKNANEYFKRATHWVEEIRI